MIDQSRLEQLRGEVAHIAPSGTVKLSQTEATEILWEIMQWRMGVVTEEMLRAHDGVIRIGRGCVIVSEMYLEHAAGWAKEDGK